ncbi:MAG: endopeptidase La [Flavobacteriales bacterium]|nr:endopeptidase La [Flavobacteriales bacterium]|tara:strand:- start:1427 stop:3850 length:2424 start_codon:yes stop_codon:yes gene_type:complete
MSRNTRFLDQFSLVSTEQESELIPLMTEEDEERLNSEEMPDILPILPLRNTVLFPGVVIPITVGRDKSIKLIKDANKKDKTIGVLSQKDSLIEDPKIKDLSITGTVAKILRVFRMPDGNTTVIIQGQKRFDIKNFIQESPYFKAVVTSFHELKPKKGDKKFSALVESVKDMALQIIKDSPNIPSEASFAIKNIESNSFLVNFVASNLNIEVKEKQKLLELKNLEQRTQTTLIHLNHEINMIKMKNEIQNKVRVDIDEQQREYFLNQQLKQIQEELGGNSYVEEIEELRNRAKSKIWSTDVKNQFDKDLLKMQRLNHQLPEYSIHRNFLETYLDLPWDYCSKDKFDLKKSTRILNKDHYGLDKIKDRIIEHLAVLKLKGDMKSPILCFVGPPGVGKTSLGKSIANSLKRKYIRMSLGGLRDESEIRGHRKTYIGAMPGRIIQSIKKAGTSNPVFVLDEIDKLSVGYQGDPSSALLEVLDPEQNFSFYDNYLERGYDLSKVLFIATANSLSTIQPALRDRMEIINVTGYTIEEKIQIAKKHLLPKQIINHGLNKNQIRIGSREFEIIIESYTSESGVRSLEKVISKLVRYIAKSIAMQTDFESKINKNSILKILGPPKFNKEKFIKNDTLGVTTGLAWTSVGGSILFIESSLSPGKGKLSLTGNLGKVMKESAMIAMEYIKSNHKYFKLSPKIFEKNDLHIHVPEGAVPKDGPSAGITILTSIVSILTNKKIKKKIAMSGEITLRGRVLPVGGIKEKVLAAKRAGINLVILSAENKKDIDQINKEYLKGISFKFVDEMMEVIKLSLVDN